MTKTLLLPIALFALVTNLVQRPAKCERAGARRSAQSQPGWPVHLYLLFRCKTERRVPLDKNEGVVKTEISWAVREHRFFAREG